MVIIRTVDQSLKVIKYYSVDSCLTYLYFLCNIISVLMASLTGKAIGRHAGLETFDESPLVDRLREFVV